MVKNFLIKIIITFAFTIGVIIPLETSIISKQEQTDLEICSSANNTHGGLASTIDRTLTTIGNQQLKKFLENPTSDLAILNDRKQIITHLLCNPELCTTLQQLLTIIKENELSLLSIQNNPLDIHDSSLSSVYYHQKLLKKYFPAFIENLNNSPLALDLAHYLPLDLISPIIEIVVFHIAMKYIKSWANGHTHNHHHHHHHDKDDSSCDCCPPNIPQEASFIVKTIITLLQGLHFAVHTTSVIEGVNHTIDRHDIINLIHNQLYHANQSINAISNICSLAQTHLATLLAHPQAVELKGLTTCLANDYIQHDQELDFFAPVGNTLVAYKKLLAHKKEITELYEYIGTIDAFLSVATLLRENQNTDHPYCFADFSSQETPHFAAQKAWNPMINSNDTVTNDIMLTHKQETKLIITGPNKAGKSSIMKTIGLNALLAQTFGIAAAESLTLAPFEKIITYVNINDDITQDQSMFVAEVVRADNCIKTLQQYKNKPTLVIIDDSLFKSTNYEKGQQLAYDFIKALAIYDHAIILVATHFPLLTTLQETTAEKFVNYHIALTNDTNGKITSSYKLLPGKDIEHNAFTLIQEQHSLTFA